jgi:cell division septum initiation protein DivIVA
MNGDEQGAGGLHEGAGRLRERIAGGAEDRLGKALSDLLESSVISGAIGRAFDAREKAAQAQELAMGALNLPSAADIERLTRRLRSFSQRLEGIEDALARIDRGSSQRLTAIEAQLKEIAAKMQAPEDRKPAAASKSRASRPSASASPSKARQRKEVQGKAARMSRPARSGPKGAGGTSSG